MSRSSTTIDLASLVRDAVRQGSHYVPSKVPGEPPARLLRLDMNESPYGPSPKTLDALRAFFDTNRYPSFYQENLRQAFAVYTGKPAEQIVCGAGMDDVLNTLMHTMIDPGDEVIISEPTFGAYPEFVSLSGGVTIDAPLDQDFALNASQVLAAITDCTKLIIICSPNNPTGTLFQASAIEEIVANASCLVAIDEAYAEFADVSNIELMDRYDNVAILRTMSKFAGLAGMRVGYGVFPPALMPFLNSATPAFHNVARISALAAIASLEDLDYLRSQVARIVSDRNQLADQLRELPGVVPVASETNFLLMKLPVENAQPVVQELAARGVLVRYFDRPEVGLVGFLRVTIGTTAENEIFLEELADILAGVES